MRTFLYALIVAVWLINVVQQQINQCRNNIILCNQHPRLKIKSNGLFSRINSEKSNFCLQLWAQ